MLTFSGPGARSKPMKIPQIPETSTALPSVKIKHNHSWLPGPRADAMVLVLPHVYVKGDDTILYQIHHFFFIMICY